jgi:hypothetical protein
MSAVLIPSGSDWVAVDGWGDFRIRRGDTEIGFSGEMNGWQVVIAGPLNDDEADRIVQTLTNQIEAEVGEQCEFVRYD